MIDEANDVIGWDSKQTIKASIAESVLAMGKGIQDRSHPHPCRAGEMNHGAKCHPPASSFISVKRGSPPGPGGIQREFGYPAIPACKDIQIRFNLMPHKP